MSTAIESRTNFTTSACANLFQYNPKGSPVNLLPINPNRRYGPNGALAANFNTNTALMCYANRTFQLTPMPVLAFLHRLIRLEPSLGVVIQSQQLGALPTLPPRVGFFKLQLQRRKET